MIITQTPLRISFQGGGTDFPDYYSREEGCVLSTAIDKYVFVIVKKRFDDLIYVNYSRKEIVSQVGELQHELVREAMRLTGVDRGVEITTLADVPSEGTGVGSSSSITVSLLQALYTYRGQIETAETLAHQACQIELGLLGKPIGKQDQYIAAYGDMRFITFKKDGSVTLEKLPLEEGQKRRLNENLLLFFTNRTRQSSSILAEQRQNIEQRREELGQLKLLAHQARACLLQGCLDDFGALLHRGWELKKQLASGISNREIDEIYHRALQAGAIGGKITGAGGGGFLLLYCPKQKQDEVRVALHHLRELPFHFEIDGSKVIFNIGR